MTSTEPICEKIKQPVKRKRALRGRNPSGIAGRDCDE